MVRLLIGGSPCTAWSIAQKNNRETTAEGIGWELFKNYLIAKEKFQPDFFLYENNKSMAKPIKEQITYEFGVEPILINSALVSAQNRQRFYWNNLSNVKQPEDRGILLRDILVSGAEWQEKAYCLTASYNGAVAWNTLERKRRSMVAEPVCLRYERTEEAKRLRKQYEAGEIRHGFNELRELHPRTDGKTNTLSTVQKDNMIAEPVRVGDLPNERGEISGSQATRIYSIDGKSVNLVENGGGQGAKTGLYACPIGEIPTPYVQRKMSEMVDKYGYLPDKFCAYNSKEITDKSPTMTTMSNRQGGSGSVVVIEPTTNKQQPIYEVRNGYITIKDKQYPIKLQDGYYIIRKLTVTECCRLQTMPDDYCRAVSATQGYKGLGNGWTSEVIIHILKHANIPLNEHIEVLSMYDGIGTGRYCLDKMGYSNITYRAYEIDKYAMQIAGSNYSDIIQHGDAFQVRNEDWRYK